MRGSWAVHVEDVTLLDGTYSSCGILSDVPTYRMGEAAELLGVSPDTVRRWSDAGRLPTLRTEGGHRRIDGAALAGFAASLAAEQRPPAIVSESARNRLTGLVTRVVSDTVMAQVEIQAGPFRVVSLMSREAADELGLAPGVLAVASVKATNVVVELPAHREDTRNGKPL
jgi:molybdopterin-binding protein